MKTFKKNVVNVVRSKLTIFWFICRMETLECAQIGNSWIIDIVAHSKQI